MYTAMLEPRARSHAIAPTAVPPDARPQRRTNTSSRPLSPLSPAPTAAHPVAHPQRRRDTYSEAPTGSNARTVPALSSVSACPLIPRVVMLPRPLQHLQVIAPSGECTRVGQPSPVLLWLLPHPCQSLGVVPSSIFTERLKPRAAMRPRPLQRLQVPAQKVQGFLIPSSTISKTPSNGTRSPWPRPAARRTCKTPGA